MSTSKQNIIRVSEMLSAWRTARGTRHLVYLISLVGVIDVSVTWMLVEEAGVAGELNPIILHLHQAGLFPVWSVIAVTGSLIGGMALASISVISTGVIRRLAALAFGSLLGLRLAAVTVSVGGLLSLPLLRLAGVLMAVPAFLLVERYLMKGLGVNVDLVLWTVKDHMTTFMGALIGLSQAALLAIHPRTGILSGSESPVPGRRLGRPDVTKILISVTVIAVTLLALLGLLDLLQGHVFRSVPWWLRELGIVEQLQGQAFLVVFIAILVTIAVVIYCLLSVSEALGKSED